MLHLGSYYLEAVVFKSAVNLTNDVFGDSVRFDDGNGTFNGHESSERVGNG
jgi:hypothetical protein